MQQTIRVPSVRLYLDESGDHLYEHLQLESHCYLTLLGCIFEREQDYLIADKKLKELKSKYWPNQDPDNPVVFHREDMVRKNGDFKILSDEQIRKQFNTDLLQFLKEASFTVINITLDKLSHRQKYKLPDHPYHYCLEILLERFALWLTEENLLGDVMAESRGKEDLKLKQAYREIWQSGSKHQTATFFQSTLTSTEIKIKPKSMNITGLQIADLLAYPLKQKLLATDNPSRQAELKATFGNQVCEAVMGKIRKSKDGKTIGYGEVLLK